MMESPRSPRGALRALIVLAVAAPLLAPLPAAAVDIFSRNGEVDLLLREPRRLKGLQVTVEVRFVTVSDEFLERVGVDFSGSVSGDVTRNNSAVAGAKIILEAYKVRSDGTPPKRTMTKTGRTTVVTGADGKFRTSLKELISSEVRKEILDGKVDALVVEGTGKNGKKIGHVHLLVETALGGLIP